MNKRTLMVTAMSSLLAIGATSVSVNALAAGKEKCYGVAKAGKNDCATKTNSCAGTVKQDGDKGAFIVVPKGLCEKLAHGSLRPM